MHGNMVFSRDSIFPTPQQSGCLLACSVDVNKHKGNLCYVTTSTIVRNLTKIRHKLRKQLIRRTLN